MIICCCIWIGNIRKCESCLRARVNCEWILWAPTHFSQLALNYVNRGICLRFINKCNCAWPINTWWFRGNIQCYHSNGGSCSYWIACWGTLIWWINYWLVLVWIEVRGISLSIIRKEYTVIESHIINWFSNKEGWF